jgi:probable rRNA maturation factor
MMRLIIDLEGWSLENEPALLDWLKSEAKVESLEMDDIQFILIGDEEIKELNEQYLQHDGATDVITFNYRDLNHDDAAAIELDPDALAMSEKVESETNTPNLNSEEVEISEELDEEEAFPEAEIYVSLDTAKQQAIYFGCTVTEEVSRLLLHGVLHLAGWGDETAAKRGAMNKREDEGLARVGRVTGALTWQFKHPVETRG